MVLVFFLLIHSRCGVSNLGFTAIFVDQHLLVETTLRTYFKTKGVCHICKKKSARRNVTPVRFSKDTYFHFRFQYTYAEGSLCEYIWNLIGIYVFCFKPRAYVRWNFDHHFLKETTLRTCMYLYFTFQYTCAESFSGVACENIDKYLFFCWFFANLPSTFCVFCQLFLGGAYLELFF